MQYRMQRNSRIVTEAHMTRRLFSIATLTVLAVTGCMNLGAPVTDVRPLTAGSMERALRATVTAANATDWVPKTISAEAGYVMAERSDPREEPYRMVIMIPPGGSGSLSVKVTPLAHREDFGTEDGATHLVKKFYEAFEQAMASGR